MPAPRTRRRRRWLARTVLAGCLLLGLTVLGVAWQDWRITRRAAGRIFDDPADAPPRPVALVLGTSKYVQGRVNLFYRYRVEAAAKLFAEGKVGAILVSGDNSRDDYNEPAEFERDLIALGVPARFITLDYAGFRTLDSMVRAQRVFGQSSMIVVSQRFHCERALYLADAIGLDLVALAARDVGGRHGFKVRCREALARAKAFLDLHVLHTEPRFLGRPEVVKSSYQTVDVRERIE